MKSIKFRALVRGYMANVVTIDFENRFITWFDNQYSRTDPPNKAYEVESFDSSILMQFTGLCDKNGKEIYEGDVLDYKFWHNSGRASITFENGSFGMSEYDTFFESFTKYDEPENDCYPFIEIIGNIYEHPDLLTPQNTPNE